MRHIKYRATYEVFVQSMPALHKSDTNLISQNIQILGKRLNENGICAFLFCLAQVSFVEPTKTSSFDEVKT